MKDRNGTRRIAAGVLLGSLWGLAGCGGGENVTPQTLRAAQTRWQQAGIRDYDLEWTSSGLTRGHFFVAVRDGKVRTIESLQPNGTRTVQHPPEPRFYGVDGLFLTIAEELATLDTDRPFGQPKGTQAVLRFSPDPKLGYPRSYHRDVIGVHLGLAISVIQLTPNSNPATAR